jgi:hypothetical protein
MKKDRQIMNNSSRKSQQKQPALDMVVYNGPSRLPKSVTDDETTIIQLGYGGTISTNVSGVANQVLSNYAQASSSADWTSAVVNCWQEYRILSMQTKFEPWNTYNQPTTTALAPVYSVIDRSSSAAIASVSEASSYGSAKQVAPSKTFSREVKMASIEEADFLPVSSSPAAGAQFHIKLYSTGNTASTNLYDYYTIVLVQVRGRK